MGRSFAPATQMSRQPYSAWLDSPPTAVQARCMTFEKCPGAKAFTQPTPEFIPCPSCHREVEAECDSCGQMMSREMLQGCMDYCERARECLGEALYDKLVAAKGRKPST